MKVQQHMPEQEPVLGGEAFPTTRGQADATAKQADYREWDRAQWVGERQKAPGASPPPAETEPRWTKWQWIGATQHDGDPARGSPAASMPEGEPGLSGFRHNPGMGHWAGSRRRGTVPAAVLPSRR